MSTIIVFNSVVRPNGINAARCEFSVILSSVFCLISIKNKYICVCTVCAIVDVCFSVCMSLIYTGEWNRILCSSVGAVVKHLRTDTEVCSSILLGELLPKTCSVFTSLFRESV